MERMKQGNGDISRIQNTLDSLFDEDEINVAKILLLLPDLIAESECRRRFSLNWGAKRKRSAINLSPSPPPSPLRSIPPPPAPPVVNGTCGGEDGERLLIRKPEITSPATPLSFPPSESDEKSKLSSRKISKTRRKREEWLKMIAELTQQKELLQGEVEAVRFNCNKLKALNLELKAKREEVSCGEKVEAPCMETNKSLNLKMEFAQHIVIKSAMKIEDMENQQHPCSQLRHECSSSSNGDVGRVNVVDPLGIPDLNVPIEDASAMDSPPLQQLEFRSVPISIADFNKAMAAEARKKRRLICKVKNSIAANKSRYGH